MNLQRSPQAVPQVPAAAGAGGAAAPASHPLPPGAAEQPFFRFDIRRALELHRRLAWGFAITGLVLAIAYAAYTWPRYSAQSEIYIQPTSDKVMDQANAQHWPYDSNSYDSFIQQQVQLASNPDVLASALEKLPAGSFQKEGESQQAAAERLGGVIKVQRLGSSYLVAITAQAKTADLAAQIANAVANSIVEKAAHEENAGDAQRLAILTAERDRVQNQLNADLAEQSALNKELGMAAVGTEAPDLIDNAIGSTREELIKARTDHDEAEARFASLESNNAQSQAALDAEADELVASDPGLTSMKTSLNARRATLITQMANLTPNNPEYKLDSEELARINGSLDSMMQDLRAKAASRIQEKLRADLERTAGVEAQLNGQLRQLAQTAAGATPKLQRANDLVTDIVRLRSRYSAVDEELHNIMLQDSVPGAVHVSVAAAPPLHPTFSGILRKSVPLALGGILLGLLAALLATHLDPHIYIGADVEHLLGFAPMIALPDYGEVSQGAFEEHILRLSTAIEHARKQGSLRNCIFTGTSAGTGVTTVVTHVRDMLVSMGRPTILVDATGPHATAHPSSLQAASQEGGAISSLATPGGERGTRSLALLERVKAGSAAQDENLVLSDTAPLLISAETEYLARFVDCAIVVVESGVTTRAELQETADALQKLSVPAVGLVLNRVKLATADPAFRSAVEGTEAHVRTQGRASRRPQQRSREIRHEIKEESAVDPYEQQKRQPAARPQSGGVHPDSVAYPHAPLQSAGNGRTHPAPAAIPPSEPQPVAFEPAMYPPVPAQPASYAQPQAAAQREAFGPAELAAQQPLAATAEQPSAARPAVAHLSLSRNADAPVSEPQLVTPPPAPPQYEPQTAPPLAPRSTPQFALPARPALAAAPGLVPPARKASAAFQKASTPDHNIPWWLSDTPVIAPNAQGSFEDSAPEPPRPASRLSGLRNVLFGAGSRNAERRALERREEALSEEQGVPPLAEQPVQPEPYAPPQFAADAYPPAAYPPQPYAAQPYPQQPYAPQVNAPDPLATVIDPRYVPEPAPFRHPAHDFRHEEAQIVTVPEVLPPQPIAMPPQEASVWDTSRGISRRLERGDALDDDIQVLPSRRGQYRRKG